MPVSRPHRLLIAAILLVAVAARVVAFSPYAIHHPDEAVQYLEQAYRLLTGHGLVPWEYRLGMRSWLVPLLLAAPMWLGEQLAPGTTLYVVLPRLLVAAIALTPLWAAWSIGRRVSDRHGLVALAVVALWYEWVYFSVHVLTETLAVALFLPATALLLGERSRSRLIVAGALLGFACIFRFHYGPAAFVLAAMILRNRWRDWGWLIVGGLVPIAISSAVDLAMGGWPFGWVVENIRHNVIENRAADFGEFGVEAYGQMLWLAWGVVLVPILWCAWPAARRYPALAAAALVNLLVHLAIGHKEYRFILLTTQIVVLLAGIGTVDRVAGLKAKSRDMALAAAVAVWVIASLLLGTTGSSDPGWRRHGAGYALMRQAAERRTCGVALFGGDYWSPWGQLWLHGATPTYYLRGPDAAGETRLAARIRPAYDAAIAPPDRTSVPAGYRQLACEGGGNERMCLWMRTGGCVADAASDHQLLQRVMERNGR